MLLIASLASIAVKKVRSPKGKYRLDRQNVSEALGGIKDVGEWGGGQPFDMEFVRLLPGAVNFPFHAHAAQWELYAILSGTGEVRGAEGWAPVKAGDHLIFKPGEPHQLRNTGAEELTYYVVTNQPRADMAEYPDTPGKRMVKPGFRCFTEVPAEYYEPEE